MTKEEKERELMWRGISNLLMENDEDNPQPCSFPLYEDEAVGMSSLDLPWAEYVFQDPSEGTMWIRVEGMNGELVDMSDLSDSDLKSVYDNLVDIKGYTPRVID